ncbi:unnamed protein product [Moneuplotes crassus]|uniref:Uncharacterized protein n=1 Tax=Euplotes crassus TaxID=5936 RepID=A0AAD1X8P5_EUPCR|nr:unnamed protein product [Moneuplotes crassus]
MIKKISYASGTSKINTVPDSSNGINNYLNSNPGCSEVDENQSLVSSLFETFKTVSEDQLDPEYSIEPCSILMCQKVLDGFEEIEVSDLENSGDYLSKISPQEFSIKKEYLYHTNIKNFKLEQSLVDDSDDTLNFEDSERSLDDESIGLWTKSDTCQLKRDYYSLSKCKSEGLLPLLPMIDEDLFYINELKVWGQEKPPEDSLTEQQKAVRGKNRGEVPLTF